MKVAQINKIKGAFSLIDMLLTMLEPHPDQLPRLPQMDGRSA